MNMSAAQDRSKQARTAAREGEGHPMLTDTLDLEARAHSEHAQELRLWLRLLTCSQLIEKRVRAGLREQFDTTLPRFDLMAQLERHPEGLKMKELSHRLMVTGGNVTGITDQLVAEGLVERMAVEGDRRAFLVRLTPEGRSGFERMAAQHEQWIVEAFDGLSPRDLDHLHKLLGKVKQHQLDLNQRIVNDAE